MKSCQRKKTSFRNKLHSPESSSAFSHKPKARRKFATALRKFTIKSLKAKNSTTSKSESDISETSNLNYSRLKCSSSKPVESRSSLKLNCLPLWSNTALFSKRVQTKTSSLINEYSMEPSEDNLKKPLDKLVFNPSDLPSVSQSISNETPEKFTSTLNDTRPLGLQAFNVLPSSFIPETSNTLNIPLSVALKEVLDLAVYLQESEGHIKHILAKYIQNESLAKDLLKALTGHNKLQIENERRSYKLANELFSLELDHSKTREKTLQDSLDVAAYFNRILEDEVQTLKAKNEKLLVDNQNKRECCDDVLSKNMENLHENNNELRAKYRNVIGEIKILDSELRSLQNQNRSLVIQLANANGQLRNYREMLHKEMGDHELENVALAHQLHIKEQIIKDCVEAGDVLVEDLTAIKKQLKGLSININWTKFKEHGSSIVDLLHVSRNCLNEITRQLINNNINTSNNNTNDLSNNYESKIQLQTQKIQILKSEIDLTRKEKEIINESLNNEKVKTLSQEKIINELKTQITNRDSIIKGLNSNLKECRDEIQSLTFKINGIQKFFDENQLSHVLHDLFKAQEKCTNYEKQFYHLELEKLNLSDKAKKFDYEKDSLLKYQQSFFEHLQQQQKDIEELNRQNDELKKQLHVEREKLIGKSAELARQIEATNLMQTVQTHMNTEYSKNLSLEANALTTNYELNRLSVVADYNNEISKQLKEMIAAKDKIIAELKTNLDKLNANDKKNFEEKTALCNEITEASYIIKQLQNELENEKYDKKKILNEKERNEKNADCKIQELHQMIIEERQALRALLKEYQNVLNQKNNIDALEKEHLLQIENYADNELKMKITLNELNEKCNELEQKLREVYEIIDAKENKVRSCANEYENKLSSRDGIIEKQKCKNEELQNTIKYLQCNIQKLQSDLNELRSNEKAQLDQIKHCSSLVDKFQKDLEELKQQLEKCNIEKQELEERLTEAVLQYNSLYEEYNKYYEETQHLEEQYKNELDNYKQLNTSKNELLEKCSKENIAHIEKKQLEINKIKEEMERLDKVRSEFSEKTRILEEALNKQQQFDANLIQEKDRCLRKVKDLTKAVNSLKAELESCMQQRDEDIMHFKKFTADLKNDSEIHKKIMQDDLNKLSSELSELSEKCSAKSSKLHDLRLQYKEMTDNMKKVLNLLIRERYEHKIVEAQKQLLMKELENIRNIQDISITDTTTVEGNICVNDLVNAKKTLDEATANIEYLEKEVQITTEKLRKLEEITIMQENYMMSQLQNKSDLVKSVNREHEILLERYNKLKQHSKMTSKIIITLKAEITHLNEQIQILEFHKCDLMLKYQELNGKLQNEQSLNRTLKQTHQQLLATAYEMSSPSSVQSISYNLD